MADDKQPKGKDLLTNIREVFRAQHPSSSMIDTRRQDEDGAGKKPFKMLIEFGGGEFDFFDLVRIEEDEPYDKDALEGVSYVIRLFFKSFPYTKEYRFDTEEQREANKVILTDKLEKAGAIRL